MMTPATIASKDTSKHLNVAAQVQLKPWLVHPSWQCVPNAMVPLRRSKQTTSFVNLAHHQQTQKGSRKWSFSSNLRSAKASSPFKSWCVTAMDSSSNVHSWECVASKTILPSWANLLQSMTKTSWNGQSNNRTSLALKKVPPTINKTPSWCIQRTCNRVVGIQF